MPGQEGIEGREAVVAACEKASAEMDTLTTSVVSPADIYEFDADGRVTVITSYTVELDA